ncbi:MAG: hypothetical protein N2376_15375, partial [Clostridia bacterium]|nr:hypothetical protein [Clostridia bacterium]
MSKKLLTTLLATMLVLAVAISATGCGANNPKGVISAFFDSIDKADAKKFLNCFDKDTKDTILDGVDES